MNALVKNVLSLWDDFKSAGHSTFSKDSKKFNMSQNRGIVQEEFKLLEDYVTFALEIDKNKTRK